MRKYIFISLAFLCGCSSEKYPIDDYPKNDKEKVEIILSPDEYVSISNDHNGELSEAELFKMLSKWVKTLEQSTQTRGITNLNPSCCKVLNKYYVSGKQDNVISTRGQMIDEQLQICEIGFENNGLPGRAVVTADGRGPKVLAFIPVYIDSLERGNTATKLMLKNAEQALISEIEHINYLKDSLRASTINIISDKLMIPVEDVNINKISDLLIIEGGSPATIETIEPENAIQGVGPLSMTEWNGYSPYNRSIPVHTNNYSGYDNGYYDFVGPTISTTVNENAIAISQLLAIYQPRMICNGISINWDYLLETPYIFEPDPNIKFIGPMPDISPKDKCQMVGYLFRDVSDRLNTIYVNKGGGNRWYYSTYITASNIESFIRNYFTANINSWDTNSVIRSLQNFSPVVAYVIISNAEIIRSAQHTFLVDGYRMCQEQDNAPIDIYLHINQGRGLSGNGYYYVNKNYTVNFSFNGVDYPLTSDTMIAVTDIKLKTSSIN